MDKNTSSEQGDMVRSLACSATVQPNLQEIALNGGTHSWNFTYIQRNFLNQLSSIIVET
jgi:hypothetical protein